MIDKIKYFAKLSSTAAFSFVKIYVLAIVTTFTCITISIFYLFDGFSGGHVGGGAAGLIIFTQKPVQSVAFLLIGVCMFLIMAYANKYVMNKVISILIRDKAESTIYPLLDKVIARVKAKQPNAVKTGTDYAVVKLQLIDSLRYESENKWLKKALVYGLKKINLEDIDFKRRDMDFYEILKIKAVAALQNVTTPSRNFIWIMVALQIVFTLIIVFM